jgi:hypothetical protein
VHYCTPPSRYPYYHVLADDSHAQPRHQPQSNNPCHHTAPPDPFPASCLTSDSRAMLDSPLRAGSPLALSENCSACLSSQLTSHAQRDNVGLVGCSPPASDSPLPRLSLHSTLAVMHMQCTCTHSRCVMGATSSLPRVFSDRQHGVRLFVYRIGS